MTKTLIALLFAGWTGIAARPAFASLNVVATVPDLAALAKEVGGKHITVKAISLPSQDPHFVDARPNLVLDLNKADLLLSVGLQLEIGWLPVLLTSARNPAVQPGSRGYLECAQFVRLLEVPLQPIDRSMGDIHPGGNPHFFQDPRRGAEVAKGIAGRMGEIDPANRDAYQANLAAFLKRLEASRRVWEQRMERFRGTPIIGYHRTLAYLAEWLGLTQVEFMEPKPGIPPSPAHVARLIAVGRERKVRIVLQETYYPTSTSTFAAQKLGAVLVRFPAGTDAARGQTYLQYIDALVGQLERALQPTKGK